MTDYKTLKEMLIMAEVLTGEFENKLEVKTYTEPTEHLQTVVFEFNDENELINIFIEE